MHWKRCIWNSTQSCAHLYGKTYAVKKLRIQNVSRYDTTSVMNEMRVLATHRSPFLINLKAAFIDSNMLCLVMEYATKVIWDVSSNTSATLSERDFLSVVFGITFTNNDWHRTLASNENNSQISNRQIYLWMQMISLRSVTSAFRAHCNVDAIGTHPRWYATVHGARDDAQERYDVKVDVWALGCVLCELMTLKPAFYGRNITELKSAVLRGRVDVRDSSPALCDVLSRTLCVRAAQRASINDIIIHPIVTRQLQIHKLDNIHRHNQERHSPTLFGFQNVRTIGTLSYKH